jgi:multidrug efflux system outer membrane protein
VAQAFWELDIWGRIRRSNEAARATLLATEEARRGVWLTLVSDLAQAYFELLALEVQLAIARDSTTAFQRTYDLFLDRFEMGVASKLETARAEALGRRATIPQLERHRRQEADLRPAGACRGRLRSGSRCTTSRWSVVPAGLPSTLLARPTSVRPGSR